MIGRISVVLSLILGLTIACGSQREEVADQSPIGVFQEAPCPVTIPDGWTEGKEITCGYVIVPERHAQPDGPTLKLTIAKIASISESPNPDPLVPLPTGPGTSAFDSFLDFLTSPVGAEFLKTREAVIFEQRGLLYSEPNLVCAESHSYFMNRQSQNWSGQESVEKAVEALEACRQSLQDKGVNLDAFKYVESAADLIMVMDALGYEKFNALGISAGTMLAQRLSGPGDRFAWGLGYSVFCSESPEITEERITFDGLFPAYEEAVANLAWGPRVIMSICDMWGVERLSPELSTLPVSDVPTLVMSGEFDSITPPEAAARVAANLTNAYECTIPGAGHSAIESGPCSFSIALQFLENPSKEPDASCISDLGIQFQVPGNQ